MTEHCQSGPRTLRQRRADPLWALAILAAALPAHAQNPEKFERVAPARPKPSPSVAKPPARAQEPAPPRSADPAAPVKELMRKAVTNEEEKGFCATVSWREIGDWSTAFRQAAVGESGPLAALFGGRATIMFRATNEGN